jgi:hypothetical protein
MTPINGGGLARFLIILTCGAALLVAAWIAKKNVQDIVREVPHAFEPLP